MSDPYRPEPLPTHWLPGPSDTPCLSNLPMINVYANAVYYPNWRVYGGDLPSSMKFSVISHVLYAFAWVKLDGTVFLSDVDADTQMEVDGEKGCLGAFAALKRQHHHLKLLLSIGGGGAASQSFPVVASDPTARENFGRSARDLVRSFGLDGVDVDWEHPKDPEEGSNYLHLLAILRHFLPSPYYILTSALPAGEWALRNIDLGKAQEYLDYVNLMTYDFSGPWAQTSGHHAQLFTPTYPQADAAKTSCHCAVKYVVARGVPPRKILLGIPVYGRSFLGVHNIGQQYTGHGGQDGTFDYKELPRPGSIEYVDEKVGAAFCVGSDGGFVSYDNPQTVKMKGAYAASTGLGGLFYWTGPADLKGRKSLVEAGFTALHA